MTDKKKKQKAAIIVTKHAVERYIERTISYDLNITDIQNRLKQAAISGKRVAKRRDNAWEVEHHNLILVAKYDEDVVTVITCLGTKQYRNWCRLHNRVA